MTRQVGVEEEFLLVNPETGEAAAAAGAVLRAAGGSEDTGNGTLEAELQRQQLEINTDPCVALADLDAEIRRCRTEAAQAARRAGAALAALGTSPVPAAPDLTRKRRYQVMAEEFGLTAQDQLTCGCHVHVQIASPDEGVAVIDRLQPWLPVLLALSANSPFWQGTDSGYASYRYQSWGRWPSAGPTGWFGSAQAYEDTVAAMLGTGTVLDRGMIYFNARLSEHYPTVELRAADVCLRPSGPVLLAALARALVETEARAWRADPRGEPARHELLVLAAWRASRSGLEGDLIDPATGRPRPAKEVAAALLEHVRPALEEAGDDEIAAQLLAEVLARGNGAVAQRERFARTGELRDVVTMAVRDTLP